jgi:transcriptional regulator with XRE-family HTH domain
MLSQQELADAAGLSLFTIQRVESGHGAQPSTGRALATVLGIEPEKLFENPSVPLVEAR